jgi:hypothetical protein
MVKKSGKSERSNISRLGTFKKNVTEALYWLTESTTRHFHIFSAVFYASSYTGRGSDALLRLRPAEQGAKP